MSAKRLGNVAGSPFRMSNNTATLPAHKFQSVEDHNKMFGLITLPRFPSAQENNTLPLRMVEPPAILNNSYGYKIVLQAGSTYS
jgi:hypothetical protein